METPAPPRPQRTAGRWVAGAAMILGLAAMTARSLRSPLGPRSSPEAVEPLVGLTRAGRVELSRPGTPVLPVSEPRAVAALVALYDAEREGWREAFGTPPGPAVSITYRSDGGAEASIGLGRGFLRKGDRVKTLAPSREAEWLRALDDAAPSHGPWLLPPPRLSGVETS